MTKTSTVSKDNRTIRKLFADWQEMVVETDVFENNVPVSLSLSASGAWLIKYSCNANVTRFTDFEKAIEYLAEEIPQVVKV